MSALCPHLAGVVRWNADDQSWDCPCHGSRYDMAGRVYKGVPAPLNLEVPPYKYLSDSVVLIGEA